MDRDWQNEVLGFSFADVWALVLVPILIALWIWRVRRKGPALGYPASILLDGLPVTWRVRLASLPQHLFALGLVPICLALARPQKLTRLPTSGKGVDILICLDVSSSMSAGDMDKGGKRSRLDVAKDVAKRFIDGRPNDRIGLLVFALFPDLVCPMTLDHPALWRFLEPIHHKRQNDPEDRTGIGGGLANCVKLLEKSEAESKVVILLTDGAENVNYVSPEQAGKLAADAGVRVYTIGIGRGVRGPFFGVRKPDFSALSDIAKKTGGMFWEADDERALDHVFEKIDELERTELTDPVYLAEEIFFPFLAVGAALLFVSFALRLTWLAELP